MGTLRDAALPSSAAGEEDILTRFVALTIST
jgi:hypothetical protein